MNSINENKGNENNIIKCRASNVINLLKTRDDRRHFCMEMSKITKQTLNFIDWLFPNEKGFNTTFLLKVMSGEKKVTKI